MRLLVLGGTEFVGHALVAEGLACGWEVTVVNRGSKAAPEGVGVLTRDRRVGLDLPPGREWDIVADTWSWEPRVVRDSAHELADRVARYVYVSTRSVHSHPTASLATEDAPTVEANMDDDHFDDYARAKRGAELSVLDAFGDRAVLARPGLIIGPRENIGRLPWWLTRAVRGGDIIAPGSPESTFQHIDARDLAAFALSDVAPGAYSLVTEPESNTMGELLSAVLEVTGSTGELRWLPEDYLLTAGVQPWMDLPVWINAGEDHATMHEAGVSKAIASGLRPRPLRETVADTWEWLQSIGGVAPQRPDRPVLGLDPDRERELLEGFVASKQA
jgi:nucleoside-diphosphate-sugar epimerase